MKKILVFCIGGLISGFAAVVFNIPALAYVLFFCFISAFVSLIYESVVQMKESNRFHKSMKLGDECWVSGGDRSFDGIIKEIDGINITVEVKVPIGRINPIKNKIA
jgi:preprotein translocase subunit YajC